MERPCCGACKDGCCGSKNDGCCGSKNDEIRAAVREGYASIALAGGANDSCGQGCCGYQRPSQVAERMGYTEDDLADAPKGSNLGLGCGNPTAIAELKAGETVLDLGSGAGFDGFLAARKVGETGHVIGVDMTPEMLTRARSNAVKGGYTNVEFRLGEIEHLPLADSSVDVIISNCVINLSPDKMSVFSECFRVLKPGGRICTSDIVLTAVLPEELRCDVKSYCGCIAGALPVIENESMLRICGFEDIDIAPKEDSKEFINEWIPGKNVDDYIISAIFKAKKSLA